MLNTINLVLKFEKKLPQFIKFIIMGRLVTSIIALFSLVFILSVISPYFFTISNLMNIILQSSINTILAVGMTLVIISGGIDLSAGSVLGVTGVCTALTLKFCKFWPLGILVGLFLGALFGLTNGIVITKGKLPPFIATLGMLGIARAFALIFTEARPVFGMPSGFINFFAGHLWLIPSPAIIALIVGLIGYFVLSNTTFGRYNYAIGGNQEAARRFGIKVIPIKIRSYIICSTLAALGSFIQTARLNAADPNAGLLYELDAIAASVIGGASLMGGKGNIIGTVLGALIMGVIRNGLNLLNVQAYYQQLLIGSIIIGAVWIDTMRNQ